MEIKKIFPILAGLGLLFALVRTTALAAQTMAPSATTYYVSKSMGDDNNNGLSEGAPFENISKINNLNLQPGDQVLFKCGDVWRADPLEITQSGESGQPITFGSYPDDCTNQPVLSGAYPISGWTLHEGNIYVADLTVGENADKFAFGINQLFRSTERLPMGRWPNLDAGDGGYSTIDDQPSGNSFRDEQLPDKNWVGAVAHIKGMRWYILNREVTGRNGTRLFTGSDLDCWGSDCEGWGYFLNNHLSTLDQDGEWFYDDDDQKIYLVSTSGTPIDGSVEGSVILKDDGRAWGGIVLGEDLFDPIAYVTIENLAVQRWYRNGITTPTNLHPTENHDLIIQNNIISDVDRVGINLATWVWGADDGRESGWRGGYNQTVNGNTIERANNMGINTYARNSTFSNNIIRDIGLIENLGAAGMGCGLDAGGGSCTEDGDGFRIKIDQGDDSGNNNLITSNRLERIAHNGLDVFGFSNTFEHNVIEQACYAKGDCGGVRTFGRDDMTSTDVHDLIFTENIIVDTIGNTDGCLSTYDALFGFGLYLDHFSRDITVEGNTIISSTVHGVLFQNATGTVTNNTFYNNGRTYPYAGAQVIVGDAPAAVSTHTGNILYSLNVDARTLSVSALSQFGTSNNNYFFSPYRDEQIRSNGDKTLVAWQAYSGQDYASKEHWFTLATSDEPLSRIFYNDTDMEKDLSLGNIVYKDLDQNLVWGTLTLQPYQSEVLVETEQGADLVVAMELLSSADTIPGDPVTYTISLQNQGLITANSVTLESTLPAEVVDSNWEADPNTVSLVGGTRYTWDIGDLAVGETYTFTVTGRYDNSLVASTPLALRAVATTTSPELILGNNQGIIFVGEWKKVYMPLIYR